MPVVPFTPRQEPEVEEGLMPTHKDMLMATAITYQRQMAKEPEDKEKK